MRELGGQLRLARAVPGRESIDLLVGDLRARPRRAPASTCGSASRRRGALGASERPDGIVLATGAVAPRTTSLAIGGAYAGGFPAEGTVDAFAAASDPAALGRRIAVVDADGTAYASGIVLTLLEAVDELTLITPFETAFPHVGAGYDRPLLFEQLAAHARLRAAGLAAASSGSARRLRSTIERRGHRHDARRSTDSMRSSRSSRGRAVERRRARRR